MIALDQLTDQQFERHALEVLKRELGADGLARGLGPNPVRAGLYFPLIGAFRERIGFAVDAEITLEANPGTVERGRFAGYRDAGINRVSLGAQSFSPRALERLGRIHRVEDTQRAAAELHAAGLGNFNLDLMYALPEQTLEEAIAAGNLPTLLMVLFQLTGDPRWLRPPCATRPNIMCRSSITIRWSSMPRR